MYSNSSVFVSLNDLPKIFSVDTCDISFCFMRESHVLMLAWSCVGERETWMDAAFMIMTI